MNEPRLRPSTDDDLAAMIAITGAHWLSTTGQVHPMDVERLRAVRSLPGRDPGLDNPVVELDGAVVAWGALWAFAPYSQLYLALTLDPGLDDDTHDACVALLVGHGEDTGRARLAELGVEPDPDRLFSTEAVHADMRLRATLERSGFTFARHELEMAIDLDRPDAGVVVADPPEGVAIRPVDPDRDALTVAALLREAFVDHHGDVPFSDDVVAESLLEARPETTLLAQDAEGPIAAMISRDRGTGGYVWAIGVLRRARRRGIAPALLTRAFAGFAAAGRPHVTLDVDAESLTGATRVYERAGMAISVVRDEYVRPLD